MKKIIPICFALLIVSALSAGYVSDNLLFEETFQDKASLAKWENAGNQVEFMPNGGPDGRSNAVKCHVEKFEMDSMITIKLDPQKIKGIVVFEAMVRGEQLEPGKKNYFGPKFMLIIKSNKKNYYPEPKRETGTYDWKLIRKFYRIPDNTEELHLSTGIQAGKGTLYISNIRIHQAKEISHEQILTPIPFNKKASEIPRGNFTGTSYRGVMSGSDFSPEAFEQLNQWGANLIRYQFNTNNKNDTATRSGYFSFIDRKIKELDSILPLAEKYKIKIVIDLHVGPGTVINNVANNILAETTDLNLLIETWRKIATHYKGNSQIYGYDLLNEPVAENYAKGRPNPWQFMVEKIVKEIREIDAKTPVIIAWHGECQPFKIEDQHAIYTPHFYAPMELSHQGVLSELKWGYPGEIDGIYWDKEQIRLSLKKIIDFQQKHHVKIFIGEFGCSIWTPYGRDQYLKDCIEIFEEYGWDWTYHAFREWIGWSAEHVLVDNTFEKKFNSVQHILMTAMQKNRKLDTKQ